MLALVIHYLHAIVLFQSGVHTIEAFLSGIPSRLFFHQIMASNKSQTTDAVELSKDSASLKKFSPIFIPIGPQAAGKTMLLSKIDEKMREGFMGFDGCRELVDVAIDDQEGVYISIPSYLFLRHNDDEGISSNEISDFLDNEVKGGNDGDKLLDKVLYNKTILERLDNQSEMRWVIQRLLKKISSEDFRNVINSITNDDMNSKLNWLMGQEGGQNPNIKASLADFLVETVEQVIREKNEEDFTAFADLFVVEAIFRDVDASVITLSRQDVNDVTATKGDLSLRKSGLKSAISKFNHLACNSTSSIAWGNCNTKPSDYESALEAGEKSLRPVYFIPFVQKERLKISQGLFLQWISFQKLIDRNIRRLYSTGRYIPVRSILEASIRIERLMTTAAEMKQSHDNSKKNITKFEFDSALANLAGFQMHQNRTVTRLPPSIGGGKGQNIRGGRGRLNRGGRGRLIRGGKGQSDSVGGDRFDRGEKGLIKDKKVPFINIMPRKDISAGNGITTPDKVNVNVTKRRKL